jgi:2-oxoglutarate ferredoxin oxidoreductase subunit alpha
VEAVRIATQFMTPVMLLTDGYIANAAEPWKVPDVSVYKPFPVSSLIMCPKAASSPMGVTTSWHAPG